MTTELRILTVRQPWAWAIIHGGKDVENRVRNIAGSYRGPVAIHVGLAIDDNYDRRRISEVAGRISREKRPVGMRMVPSRISEPNEPRFHVTERYGYRGAIIGVVDLVDVHKCAGTPTNRPRCYEAKANGFTEAVRAGTGLCSPWADQFAENHLVLANPRPLAEPISFKGALGLRRLDDTTTAAVWSQTGA